MRHDHPVQASSKLLAFLVITAFCGQYRADMLFRSDGPNADGGCASKVPVSPSDAAPMLGGADYTVVVNAVPLSWNVNGSTNPTLTLTRGQSYTFDLTGVGGAHPFVINSNAANAGGTIYAGPASGTTITFTPDLVMPATIYYHCTVHISVMVGTINLVSPPTTLSAKVFLEGAYDSGTGLMRDDLRAAGIIPLSEPYTALGYAHVSGNAGATVPAAVLTAVGNNAVVDWVVVELRNNAAPGTVVQSRCALVQRDGDIVDNSGSGPVVFTVANGTYRVAVRHRSHLGAMTLNGVALPGTAVDLTSPATATFGTNATKAVGAVQALWMGDANFNGAVAYTGAGNDRDPILLSVGSTTPNNTVNGYLATDLNLNGTAGYTGSGNDRDPILVNVGNTTPNNVRVQQLP